MKRTEALLGYKVFNICKTGKGLIEDENQETIVQNMGEVSCVCLKKGHNEALHKGDGIKYFSGYQNTTIIRHQ